MRTTRERKIPRIAHQNETNEKFSRKAHKMRSFHRWIIVAHVIIPIKCVSIAKQFHRLVEIFLRKSHLLIKFKFATNSCVHHQMRKITLTISIDRFVCVYRICVRQSFFSRSFSLLLLCCWLVDWNVREG